ncbi:Epimerase family protein [BD1-7 clade bacterium]|uniref:Epimerase family protein n=1 Tax=BD1-7 clade bacterium TaxID=2029982 RepID=A0A5S9QA04_9GAMM|nr:Epimerase family protein [BD1-7 clade bacterium]CAA0114963.1 Epimerase family protein [BD1-7 clade bacterium]
MQYKDVLMTGGTGFIGRALCEYMLSHNKNVWVYTRNKNSAERLVHDRCHYVDNLNDIAADQNIDAVINLAGQSLNSGRWTTQLKQTFIQSRVSTTRTIVEWIEQRQQRPAVLISGSAIGWYGHQGSRELDEDASAEKGFSHSLCNVWEKEAINAEPLGVRVVLLRTGIVLEKDGGPLKNMILPFKLGLGGRMGSGKQYWSWIHRKDLIRMMDFLLQVDEIDGPVNGTAPYPVTQKYFASTLGMALIRPTMIPMPSFVANLIIGEFASEVLLQGQRVFPSKATHAGFHFQYATLERCLHGIFHPAADLRYTQE